MYLLADLDLRRLSEIDRDIPFDRRPIQEQRPLLSPADGGQVLEKYQVRGPLMLDIWH